MSEIRGYLLKTENGNARLSGYHLQLLFTMGQCGLLTLSQIQELSSEVSHGEQSVSRVTLNKWKKLNIIKQVDQEKPSQFTFYALASNGKQLCNIYGVNYQEQTEPVTFHTQAISTILYSFFLASIKTINELTLNETISIDLTDSGSGSPVDTFILQTTLISPNKQQNPLIPDISISNSSLPGQSNMNQKDVLSAYFSSISPNDFTYNFNRESGLESDIDKANHEDLNASLEESSSSGYTDNTTEPEQITTESQTTNVQTKENQNVKNPEQVNLPHTDNKNSSSSIDNFQTGQISASDNTYTNSKEKGSSADEILSGFSALENTNPN